MLKRMIGVLILRPAAYLEIAKDTTATGQAAVIMAGALFIQGIIFKKEGIELFLES